MLNLIGWYAYEQAFIAKSENGLKPNLLFLSFSIDEYLMNKTNKKLSNAYQMSIVNVNHETVINI